MEIEIIKEVFRVFFELSAFVLIIVLSIGKVLDRLKIDCLQDELKELEEHIQVITEDNVRLQINMEKSKS